MYLEGTVFLLGSWSQFLTEFIGSFVQIFVILLTQSVQSLRRVRLFATPWIAARQASLSITISQSSLKLTSIELVMPSSHFILCRPLFLLPPIPPSIRVFFVSSVRLINGASQVALVVKNPPVNAGEVREVGSIPRSGRFLGGGCGNPL